MGDKAVGGGGQAIRSWGISRPSRHLKRRLITHTGEISPEGEIARPRVQAVVEPGNVRGFVSEAQSLPIGHDGQIVFDQHFCDKLLRFSGFAVTM
jgi:hypothetical protein